MKIALFNECSFSDQEIKLLLDKGVKIKKAPNYLQEEKIIQELSDCNIFIIGGADKATKKVIESTNLELIIFFGTGYESHVNIPAANAKGIPVANTPKANAYTVAEHTLALILDAVKQISYLNTTSKQGQGLRRQAWNLQGKTLGIVGLGTIGGNVARIMRNGFKMNILYVSRKNKKDLEKELGAKKVSLETLMSLSDVVSIHAPYSDETINLIGEEQLNLMKPHAVLVCTSRPQLVDYRALKVALEKGKLATAAFDLYYQEPIPKKEKDQWGLLSLPDNKFIVTPHTAYNSKEAVENMNRMVIENIESFLEKGRPKYLVNLGS